MAKDDEAKAAAEATRRAAQQLEEAAQKVREAAREIELQAERAKELSRRKGDKRTHSTGSKRQDEDE